MEKIKLIVYALHIKYNFHRFFLVLLFLANIFYLFYLLNIAYHNVLLVDDYWFMAKYKKYGVIKSIAWWYQNWQGRFSPQLLTILIIKLNEFFNSLLVYSIFLISFYIYTIGKIIRQILPAKFPFSHSWFLVLNYSLFLFNMFLIANIEFSTFYWINVSTMYFGGIVFALLATSELVNKSKTFISYLLIFVGFTYAGSSAEHFGAICTFLLCLYFFFIFYQQHIRLKDIASNTDFKKAIFAFFVCLISFIIMVSAPGNGIRRSDYPDPSILKALFTGFKSFFYLFTLLLTEKIKYLVIVSLPFIYLGTLFRKKDTVDEFKTTLVIAGSLLIFIVFIYICLLPSAYAISDIGPFRALTHIIFFLISYIAFISFLIGYKTFFSKKLAFILSVVCCVFFILISRDRIKLKLPDTIKFTESEKNRINHLLTLKAKGNKEDVILDSNYRSDSNVLFHYELAKDSTISHYWINKRIEEGLVLDYKISIKSK